MTNLFIFFDGIAAHECNKRKQNGDQNKSHREDCNHMSAEFGTFAKIKAIVLNADKDERNFKRHNEGEYAYQVGLCCIRARCVACIQWRWVGATTKQIGVPVCVYKSTSGTRTSATPTCILYHKLCQAQQLRPYIGFVSPSRKAKKDDSIAVKVVAASGEQCLAG